DQPGLLEHATRFLLTTFSGHVLSDSLAMAHYIMHTDLDWTIPRGPRIVNGEHTGTYRIGYVGVNNSSSISYADIADFIVKEAAANQHLHDAPVVSY
ncbi:MAG: NAD(P)H-binding protein, partial [Anaerolineae bacterium]